jgi:hypothetical protein
LRLRRSRPAFSRTRKCFETAGSDMSWGRARSVTRLWPRARCARICRRVGSASAAKVRFNVSEEYLTIWLTISGSRLNVQTFFLLQFAEAAGRRPGVMGAPISQTIATSEPNKSASPVNKSRLQLCNGISNALAFGAWHKRRYNDIYESACVNASLFTTYGIFVGSPP